MSRSKITLDELPNPQSRMEVLLRYIAENIGFDGDGLTLDQIQAALAQVFKTVRLTKNQLIFGCYDGTEASVDLSTIVDWGNLKSVNVFAIKNHFNPNKIVTEFYYDSGTTTATSIDWHSYIHPTTANQSIRIMKKHHDSSTIVFLDSDKTIIHSVRNGGVQVNGWVQYDINVPDNPNIEFMGFNLYRPHNGQNHFNGTVMLFDNHTTDATEFIPNNDDGSILIDSDDVKISFNSEGTKLTSNLINLAVKELDAVKAEKPLLSGLKIFNKHKNIWDATYFRIPSLLRTKKGTLLAFADIRYNTGSDHSFIDIGCARSTDDGNSWDYRVAIQNDRLNQTYSRVMDSTSVVTDSNRIILLAGSWNTNTSWTSGSATPKSDWDAVISVSDDDGETWSNPVSIKAISPSNTVGFLGGVSNGIVMEHQNYRGRVVMPIQICLRKGSSNQVMSGCIYSDDNGETWRMSTSFTDAGNSENAIIEWNGNLIMSSRRDGNARSRGAYQSTDGGETWQVYTELHGKFTHGVANGSGCQGSWIKYVTKSGHTIGLLSHPKNKLGNWQRDHITIYMYDFNHPSVGITELLVPYPFAGDATGAGYSSLSCAKNIEGRTKLDIIFEDQGSISYKDITFVLDEIEKLSLSMEVKGARAALSPHPLPVMGELKRLFYDAGERFEIQGGCWLRCDGQSLTMDDYPELYQQIRETSSTSQETVILPNTPTEGYLYIRIK